VAALSALTNNEKDYTMKALEFVAEVDDQHQLHLELPQTPAGLVRVLVLVPEAQEEASEAENEADAVWMQAIAREWREELADSREDIYTLEDGFPIDAARRNHSRLLSVW
jgi:hypothetical protein